MIGSFIAHAALRGNPIDKDNATAATLQTVRRVRNAPTTILSNVSRDLGLVVAGEFRAQADGSGEPGDGFSGVRISGVPISGYNILGVDNDVIQFGLSATDGTAIFGAGEVTMGADGMILDAPASRGAANTNTIRWDTSGSTVFKIEVDKAVPGNSQINLDAPETGADINIEASTTGGAINLIGPSSNGITVSSSGVAITGATTIGGNAVPGWIGTRATEATGVGVVDSDGWKALALSTEDFDVAGWHSTSSNTERLTFGGTYVIAITGNIRFSATGAASDLRWGRLRYYNGSTTVTLASFGAVAGGTTEIAGGSLTTILSVQSGHYVFLEGRNNSGTSTTMTGSLSSWRLS